MPSFAWEDMAITHDISMRDRLLELVDRQLDKDFAEWEHEAQEALGQIEDFDAHMWYSDNITDEYVTRGTFKEILFHSFFAASFASFEHDLLLCCERAQRDTNNHFSVKDLKARGYARNAKIYLERLGVVFPANTAEWREIMNYQKIRNSIVH